MATKVGTARNVELLAEEVLKVVAPERKNVSFKTLEDLLSFLGGNISEEKIVFIIDELPYWTEKGMVVGECKFKNEKIDKSIYETLVRRSKAIPCKYPVVQYLLFSLGGFSEWFNENIDEKLVALYTLDDLYG